MLWNKHKYLVPLQNGKGMLRTTSVHGLIHQIVISPTTEHTVWSFKLFDAEGDLLYGVDDFVGTFNDFSGIPVGGSKMEMVTLFFYNVQPHRNPFIRWICSLPPVQQMPIMFKVREVQ